jgi:hypothetical protein
LSDNHSQFAFAARAAVCAILLAAGALAGPSAQDQKKFNSPGASSEGQAVTERSQFYCNVNALSPTERARHKQLSQQLALAQRETKELPDGFAFRLQAGASLTDLAEWVSLERKCCPFFTFGIEMERNNGPLWLKLRGEEGVKQFIMSDFHLR